MLAHEAMLSGWDGIEDVNIPQGFGNRGKLTDLSPERRSQVVVGALMPEFRVSPKDRKTVTVQMGGTYHLSVILPPETTFKDQIKLMRAYFDLRADRIPEILVQNVDILSAFGTLTQLDPYRRGRTIEFLRIVQSLTIAIEMQVKHAMSATRPVNWHPKIQPLIQTPDHSSYPSGHATEAFAIATVLHRLMTGMPAATGMVSPVHPCFQLAFRIAANRVVAGVHFPIDSATGAVLGCAIADALLTMLDTSAAHTPSDAVPETQHADIALLGSNSDFMPEWLKANLGTPTVSAGSASVMAQEFFALLQSEWPALP